MGYELTWVDDPYEEQRSALLAAIASALNPRGDIDDLNQFTDVSYRAMEALGGWFGTSTALMSAFVVEMEAQRMFEGNESMRDKLVNQRGTITSEEIQRVFKKVEWPIAPREPKPEVVISEFDRAMASASLEKGVGVTGGVKSLMEMHPLAWATRWVAWLTFLIEAGHNGGAVVG